MASSQISIAIEALMITERTELLKRIATDFNLEFADLESNYLEPKPAKAVNVKSVKVVAAGKQCCTALTSKKEPCKFSALKGDVFCKRHSKKEDKPAPSAKSATAPVHTHELGVAPVSGECELCESHGNPVEVDEGEFEIATVESRLVSLLENEAYEEDDDE